MSKELAGGNRFKITFKTIGRSIQPKHEVTYKVGYEGNFGRSKTKKLLAHRKNETVTSIWNNLVTEVKKVEGIE